MKIKYSKLFMLILIVSLIFLLTACKGAGKTTREDGTPLTFDTHKGTKGVTLKFLPNTPPAVMYEGIPVNLNLEIRNEGAFSTTPIVYFSGYDPQIITGLPTQEFVDELEGKSFGLPQGEYQLISKSSSQINLPTGVDRYSPVIIANACYDYETVATPTVCVDPKPFEATTDKACNANTPPNVGGGQGAPVAIESIEVQPLPGRLFLRINVVNTGGGKVYTHGGGRDICPFGFDYQNLNNVHYSVALPNAGTMDECSPTSPLKLVDGRGTIFCKFDLQQSVRSIGSAFETPLEIRLWYGYMSSDRRQIEIRSIS